MLKAPKYKSTEGGVGGLKLTICVNFRTTKALLRQLLSGN